MVSSQNSCRWFLYEKNHKKFAQANFWEMKIYKKKKNLPNKALNNLIGKKIVKVLENLYEIPPPVFLLSRS